MSFRLDREDKDLQLFREVMLPPSTFEDGFGAKTIIGAIFLGLFMLPGSMYLMLFTGAGLGPAARWVTVILFSEVARRSLKSLKQQEIFILFYMTGIALSSPFQGLLWSQYLVQSDVARGLGIASEIPKWAAPSAEVIKRTGNTFFNRYWLAPILLISFQLLISRVNGFGLGYVLYRLTAHAEKLPFPMAPVSAQGVLVLAEDKEGKDRWRWTAFSVGGVLGGLFGLIYVGIPSLTGSFLGTPHQLLPIPWKDLTTATQEFLPATPTNLVFDLTVVAVGMVLPFWAVAGGFVSLLFLLVADPILQRHGMLPHWKAGMGLVDTIYSNQIDFYLAFGIGLTFAIFLISLFTTLWPLLRSAIFGSRSEAVGVASLHGGGRPAFDLKAMLRYDRLRGDIPVWISLAIYVFSTVGYLLLCAYLLETPTQKFPIFFFLAFAFLYTPIISYTSAKLEGLCGQSVSVPMVSEAAFIFSGYKGVAIWFAPIPLVDYGADTRTFREVELTGTKVTSLIKTELVTIPIVIVASLLFSEFIWRLGSIPSEAYPFTQEVWRLQALNNCLTYTSTLSGGSPFLEALHPTYIVIGLVVGVLGYFLLAMAGLPTLLLFGFVRGLGQMTPGHILPEFLGALVGRFYFEKKFGRMPWHKIAPVALAGFICGIGLLAMAAIGIALISKSISSLLY